MQREPVELIGLLTNIVEDSRFEAESNGKFVELQEDALLIVPGDPELLGSCFENVIRNAIRHTHANTGVKISLSRNNGPARFCCVEIRDQGDGVPEPHLRQIFEPCYRVDAGVSAHDSRSGMELAVARQAVHLHDGSISAANAPDGGLVVSVLLPMAGGVRLQS